MIQFITKTWGLGEGCVTSMLASLYFPTTKEKGSRSSAKLAPSAPPALFLQRCPCRHWTHSRLTWRTFIEYMSGRPLIYWHTVGKKPVLESQLWQIHAQLGSCNSVRSWVHVRYYLEWTKSYRTNQSFFEKHHFQSVKYENGWIRIWSRDWIFRPSPPLWKQPVCQLTSQRLSTLLFKEDWKWEHGMHGKIVPRESAP